MSRGITMRWLAAVALVLTCGGSYAQEAAPSVFNGGIFTSRSIWSGVYSQFQAGRGKAEYSDDCARCHDDELQGDPSEGVPPLVGNHFMTDWDRLPLADLVRRIHDTQPIDNPGTVDMDEATDLAAFILASNHVPQGNADMPTDRLAQARIRIDFAPP